MCLLSSTADIPKVNRIVNKSIYFRVSGRVQGVFFRASAQAMAGRLGLSGWVRNLPDGSVEGEASGTGAHIDSFLDWLRHGPDQARVTNLEVTDVDRQAFEGFEVR